MSFRSHLMQQFANSTRYQSRPPIVLARLNHANTSTNTTTSSNASHTAAGDNKKQQRRAASDTALIQHSNTTSNVMTQQTSHHHRSLTTVAADASSSAKITSTQTELSPNHASTSRNENEEGSSIDFQHLIQTRRTTSNFQDLLPTNNHSNLEEADTSISSVITRAIQCAITAPNHHRTEPVTFYRMISPSDAVNQLVDITYHIALRRHQSKISSNNVQLEVLMEDARRKAESKREKWRNVSAFVAVCVEGQPCQLPPSSSTSDTDTLHKKKEEEDYWYEALPWVPPQTERQLEDYAAACAATQNILLSIHSEPNYNGAKWATGPVIQCRAFRNLIGCRDDDFIVGLIMIGIPKQQIKKKSGAVTRRRRREFLGDVLRDV